MPSPQQLYLIQKKLRVGNAVAEVFDGNSHGQKLGFKNGFDRENIINKGFQVQIFGEYIDGIAALLRNLYGKIKQHFVVGF